jgi:hypothetical protein
LTRRICWGVVVDVEVAAVVGGAVEVAEDAAAVVVVASRDPPEAGEEEDEVSQEAAVLPVEVVGAIFHVHPVDPVRRADLVRQEVRDHPVAIFRGHPEAETVRPNCHLAAGRARAVDACPPAAETVRRVVVIVHPSAAEAALRNFLPAIVRAEGIARLSSRAGPVVAEVDWPVAVVHHGRVPETVRALEEERPTGPRSFPTNPAAGLQIAPVLEPATGLAPELGRALATLAISSALPVAPAPAPRLAVVSPTGPRNSLQIVLGSVVATVLAWETVRAQASGQHGPSNDPTGASAPRIVTNNGNSAWTIATTLGISGPTVASSAATISSKTAISAGTISKVRAKTARTGAMKTARTGRIIARTCGNIAGIGLRRFGTTRATFTTMCLMTVGGVPVDGEWVGRVIIR